MEKRLTDRQQMLAALFLSVGGWVNFTFISNWTIPPRQYSLWTMYRYTYSIYYLYNQERITCIIQRG